MRGMKRRMREQEEDVNEVQMREKGEGGRKKMWIRCRCGRMTREAGR